MSDSTVPVHLTQREIKGLRVALIFGVPDDAKENAPELISAIAKLREANDARSVSDNPEDPTPDDCCDYHAPISVHGCHACDRKRSGTNPEDRT